MTKPAGLAAYAATGALLFAACATPSAAQRAPGESQSSDQSADGTVLQDVAAALEQAEALRKLNRKREVQVAVESSEGIAKLMAQRISEDNSPQELRTAEIVLSAFGLIAPDYDLAANLATVMGEQVRGYYDHHDERIVVVRDSKATDAAKTSGVIPPGPLADSLAEAGVTEDSVVLVHELVHALQDQHFDFKALLDEDSGDDQELALRALIEGDATLVMMDHMLRPLGMSMEQAAQLTPMLEQMLGGSGQLPSERGNDALADAPLIIRRELLFAYTRGAVFALQLRAHGGLKALDGAFAHPPQSTEQIYHPKRYLAGDHPVALRWRDAPPKLPDAELIDEGTVGELHVRTLIEEYQAGDPDAVGTGWGGDRYLVFAPEQLDPRKNGLELCWATQWDSIEDAGEFATAAAEMLQARRARERSWQRVEPVTRVIQEGRRVDLIIARDETRADLLLDAASRARPQG